MSNSRPLARPRQADPPRRGPSPPCRRCLSAAHRLHHHLRCRSSPPSLHRWHPRLPPRNPHRTGPNPSPNQDPNQRPRRPGPRCRSADHRLRPSRRPNRHRLRPHRHRVLPVPRCPSVGRPRLHRHGRHHHLPRHLHKLRRQSHYRPWRPGSSRAIDPRARYRSTDRPRPPQRRPPRPTPVPGRRSQNNHHLRPGRSPSRRPNPRGDVTAISPTRTTETSIRTRAPISACRCRRNPTRRRRIRRRHNLPDRRGVSGEPRPVRFRCGPGPHPR